MKHFFLYDTTLRDGSQREGISLSVDDKLKITRHLDEFGMDYIEGGWPGSNPKDAAYFERVELPGVLPVTTAAGLLMIAAVLATLMPAARASRVDVVQALRTD